MSCAILQSLLRAAARIWAVSLLIASPAAAQDAAGADVFDALFGSEPASERPGEAGDGLALPSLFAEGRLLSDGLALHDLGPDKCACIVLEPLLAVLELNYAGGADQGFTVTLPQPARSVVIPAESLIASEGGACLSLDRIEQLLPIALEHDRVGQRLVLTAHSPLPVLLRLEREQEYARLRPETGQPDFALLEPDRRLAQLWSADVSSGLLYRPGRMEASGSILASGELLGLAGRARLGFSSLAGAQIGLTLARASAAPDLLGPLGARNLALGDVVAPAQPLISDTLAGRGIVISSRPPWSVDLVDRIELTGPLPEGWEAELWQDERLVAVCREGDPSGNWRFGDLALRIGRNRWLVRLHGPHGELEEHAFVRLVGPQMNAENEVEYAFGFVDGGRPLFGPPDERNSLPAAGPSAFATLDWGVSSQLTARMDLRMAPGAPPALALGMEGQVAGGLIAGTLARSGSGDLAGAVRLARRFGPSDFVFDLARHGGGESDPLAPASVRDNRQIVALEGQGRIGLGRLSLPWQLRAQSATLRGGREQQQLAARLGVPFAHWQANAQIGLVRSGENGWQGNTVFSATGQLEKWRLRGGINTLIDRGIKLGGAQFSAARPGRSGSLALDLDWDANSGAFGAGLSINRDIGPFGLSGSLGFGRQGFRVGVGINFGLWRSGPAWRTARVGIASSGAVLARTFVDADGDGAYDPEEEAVEGARFIVGSALRREATDEAGEALLRGLPAGPFVDVETQLASLPDFSLRPARAGDRLELRPGEIRPLPIPLRVTGSIEAQVLLKAGENTVPRSGIEVVLRDGEGAEVTRAITDFAGFVLFEGLPFADYSAAIEGHGEETLVLTRDRPDQSTTLLLTAR